MLRKRYVRVGESIAGDVRPLLWCSTVVMALIIIFIGAVSL